MTRRVMMNKKYPFQLCVLSSYTPPGISASLPSFCPTLLDALETRLRCVWTKDDVSVCGFIRKLLQLFCGTSFPIPIIRSTLMESTAVLGMDDMPSFSARLSAPLLVSFCSRFLLCLFSLLSPIFPHTHDFPILCYPSLVRIRFRYLLTRVNRLLVVCRFLYHVFC